jgi:hypothetical protein
MEAEKQSKRTARALLILAQLEKFAEDNKVVPVRKIIKMGRFMEKILEQVKHPKDNTE